MTWYLILSMSWTCPGGLLSGLWPAQAKPLICQPKPERFIETRPDLALRRVQESEKSRIWKCVGLRCGELEVVRKIAISVEGL